jgi:hemin uptake protein HemP
LTFGLNKNTIPAIAFPMESFSVSSSPTHSSADSSKDRPPATPTVCSRDLLQGGREVRIEHGEETYLLRLTRSGKLILQK